MVTSHHGDTHTHTYIYIFTLRGSVTSVGEGWWLNLSCVRSSMNMWGGAGAVTTRAGTSWPITTRVRRAYVSCPGSSLCCNDLPLSCCDVPLSCRNSLLFCRVLSCLNIASRHPPPAGRSSVESPPSTITVITVNTTAQLKLRNVVCIKYRNETIILRLAPQ